LDHGLERPPHQKEKMPTQEYQLSEDDYTNSASGLNKFTADGSSPTSYADTDIQALTTAAAAVLSGPMFLQIRILIKLAAMHDASGTP